MVFNKSKPGDAESQIAPPNSGLSVDTGNKPSIESQKMFSDLNEIPFIDSSKLDDPEAQANTTDELQNDPQFIRKITQVLKARYLAGRLQTYVGEDVIVSLGSKSESDDVSLRTISRRAYQHMCVDKIDQIVFFLGIAGNGHHEQQARYFIQSLLSEHAADVNEEIIFSGVILDYLTASATESRAIRFREIVFDSDNRIVGQKISVPWIDRSRALIKHSSVENANEQRIISNNPQEKLAFDIFYNLTMEADSDDIDKYKLHKLVSIPVTKKGKGQKSRIAPFKTMLRKLGFLKSDISGILSVVSAILHLQELVFADIKDKYKEEGSYIVNEEQLNIIAELLEVNPEKLASTIVTRTTMVAGTLCSEFLSVAQCMKSRDRFAETLYSFVVSWIVSSINERLADEDYSNTIGILEIPGFEDANPSSNDFGTFCANYAEELVRNHVLRSKIYTPYNIDGDNVVGYQFPGETVISRIQSPLLDIYTEGPRSIFSIFDEPHKPETAVTLINENHGNTGIVASGPEGWATFKVRHFLPEQITSYDAADFYDSNIGRNDADVVALCSSSRNEDGVSGFLAKIVKGIEESGVADEAFSPAKSTFSTATGIRKTGTIHTAGPISIRGRQRRDTEAGSYYPNPSLPSSPQVGSPSLAYLASVKSRAVSAMTGATRKGDRQRMVGTTLQSLKKGLNDILELAYERRGWYVFCIRPSETDVANKFDDQLVSIQLQGYGINSIIHTLYSEYPVSVSKVEFVERFSSIIVKDKNNLDKAQHDNIIVDTMISVDPQAINTSSEISRSGVIPKSKFVLGRSHVHTTHQMWLELERSIDEFKPEDQRIGNDLVSPYGSSPVNPYHTTLLRQRSPIKEKFDDFTLKEIKTDIPRTIENEEEEDSDDDSKKKKKKKAKKEKKKKEKKEVLPDTRSKGRRWWMRYTTSMTWMFCDCCLIKCGKMTHPDVRQAWREKVALNSVILWLSLIMLFFVQFLGKVLCPNTRMYSLDEIAKFNNVNKKKLWATWNGNVYDLYTFYNSHPNPYSTVISAAGTDVSAWFPRVDPASGEMNAICPQRSGYSKRADDEEFVYNDEENSRCQSGSTEVKGYCHDTWKVYRSIHTFDDIDVFHMGAVAYAWDIIGSYDNSSSEAWVVINKNVYNLTLLFSDATYGNLFDPDELAYLQYYVGRDASKIASRISKATLDCLNVQFFIGVVDTRLSSKACDASSIILYTLTGIMVSIVVVKFLAALQLGSKRQPESNDKFVILQVPCYTEGEDSLKKSIDSLALLDYDDTRKLILLIADGMIKGAGNDLSTPEICLKILGVDPEVVQAEPKSYIAIGDNMKQHNMGKVYSGLYYIQARAVPFLLIVKCGTETETSRPGNRGKRDSQMILMKFLNKVHYQRPMQPLDLEVYHHIKNVIGVDPYLYEYILMVDADTEVVPDSLNRLISCCVHDGKIMGIAGETRIANEKQSFITMMQVYEYYISHHLTKAFESLFGSVTCLPGCFCMYRIRTPEKKIPLLIDDKIIHEYEENNVDTLHKKNLLSLGEDRFLTTLMLKYFPEMRNKFTPDARCYTIVPESFFVLLSQRRRWINSTVHNLFELIFLPELCGCFVFSLRTVVFMDFIATLLTPASTAYLVYLIYASAVSETAPIISLILIIASYALQAIIFILKREYQHIGWLIISILALPVFSFALPLYSYWNFDDFSWGNTRKIDGVAESEKKAEEEQFDPKTIPEISWDDYEASIQFQNRELESPTVGRNFTYASQPGSVAYSKAYDNYGANVTVDPLFENLEMEDSYTIHPWTSGTYPTDKQLVARIKFIMAQTDLELLTKKKVREDLVKYFNIDFDDRKPFISDVIMAFLS